MRRSLLATAAASAAVVLTSCGVTGEPAGPATVTVTQAAPAPTESAATSELTAEPAEVDVPTEEPTEAESKEVGLFADNSVDGPLATVGDEQTLGDYQVTLTEVDLGRVSL